MKKLLVPGFEFTSKWIDKCIIQVTGMNEKENLLFVNLFPIEKNRNSWSESWNLEHTIVGFGNRDYKPLEVEV